MSQLVRLRGPPQGVKVPHRRERPKQEPPFRAVQRVANGQGVGGLGENDLLGQFRPADAPDRRRRGIVAEFDHVFAAARRKGTGEFVGRQRVGLTADLQFLHDARKRRNAADRRVRRRH